MKKWMLLIILSLPLSALANEMNENQQREKLFADAGAICAKYAPQSYHSCVEDMFWVIQNGPVQFRGRIIYKDGKFTSHRSKKSDGWVYLGPADTSMECSNMVSARHYISFYFDPQQNCWERSW
jgi:hypothetical protein